MNEDAIYNRLRESHPYLSEEQCRETTRKLSRLDDSLKPNLWEWLSGEEDYSEILVRNKFSLSSVLQLRRDGDVGKALIDLEEYRKDKNTEYKFWYPETLE